MDILCYQFLKGSLPVIPNNEAFSVNITNAFPFDVCVSFVPNIGQKMSGGTFTILGATDPTKPNSITISNTGQNPSGYYKATVKATGALITVFVCSSTTEDIILDTTCLNAANDIGPIPVPTAIHIQPQSSPVVENSTMFIPPDSPRVLVAYGTTEDTTQNIITREQYWGRQNDSICLSGHETRTVSYTVTSGRQQTSSKEDTMAASIGVSAGTGWGPVSASISASLSVNSTSFQQVTISEEKVSYISNSITNHEIEPVAYLHWQLFDVVTVFDKSNMMQASLIQLENPALVMGPYWVSPREYPVEVGGKIIENRGLGLFEYK